MYLSIIVLLHTGAGLSYAENCKSGGCHSSFLKSKFVHPPAESCENCHQPSGNETHPQKGKTTINTVQEGAALCGMCHAKFGSKKDVHIPVKNGICTFCHNPHESNEPKLLKMPVTDLCLTCHAGKADHPFVHGPTAAGDCIACHLPHESDYKPLLVKSEKEVCFSCHTNMRAEVEKKFIHPALTGGCTSCHNPHGAKYKYFFSEQGENLCFQCHPKIREVVQNGKVVHQPIKSDMSCASCHSPHASDHEKLLYNSGSELCLGCHRDLLKKDETVLHGPIKNGTCTPCHNPHASPNSKLLVKPFPSDFYVTYNDNQYELCFSCHNRDLLMFPDTSFATGFRDGTRNLHYLHVNRKEKSRSCKACHVIHAGKNPKLIAESVSFGKWALPIRFVKFEDGGSCSPGCHRKFVYNRKHPGKEPAPVEAEQKADPKADPKKENKESKDQKDKKPKKQIGGPLQQS